MSTTLLQLILCRVTTIKHLISGKSKYVLVNREKMRKISRDLRYYKAQNINYYKDIMKANIEISNKDNIIEDLKTQIKYSRIYPASDDYVKQFNKHGDTIYYKIDSQGKKMRVPASVGKRYVHD